MSEIFDSIPNDPNVDRFVDISYDFSGQIIRLLKKRGMTQHDLEEKLGKKDSEVSRWLQGNHNFTFRTAAAIEIALGANIIKIVEVVPYEEPTSERTQERQVEIEHVKPKTVESSSWMPLGLEFTTLNSKPGLPIGQSFKTTSVLAFGGK